MLTNVYDLQGLRAAPASLEPQLQINRNLMQGQGGPGGASPGGHQPCPQLPRDQDHPQGTAVGTQRLKWLPVSVAGGR